MRIKQRLTSPSNVMLTGLVISVLLSVTALVTLTGREAKGGISTSQTPSAYAVATPADQGQAIFEQKCEACHTIGDGRTPTSTYTINQPGHDSISSMMSLL